MSTAFARKTLSFNGHIDNTGRWWTGRVGVDDPRSPQAPIPRGGQEQRVVVSPRGPNQLQMTLRPRTHQPKQGLGPWTTPLEGTPTSQAGTSSPRPPRSSRAPPAPFSRPTSNTATATRSTRVAKDWSSTLAWRTKTTYIISLLDPCAALELRRSPHDIGAERALRDGSRTAVDRHNDPRDVPRELTG